MPATISPSPPDPPAARANDDYDDAVDNFLRDIPINNTNHQVEPVKDVDEEIKIRKKRTPIPKLDETLLLSEKGVPKLRKVAKTRLKFKGKGHEFNDMARLLNTYQLWLDDLYPRAKFRDGLMIVEKLGHSKRMQLTRRGWIDETKPNRKEDTPERQMADDDVDELFGDHVTPQPGSGRSEPNEDDLDMPDEEDLHALLSNPTSHPAVQPTQKQRGPFEDDSDDEDDLAALMAGPDVSHAPITAQTSKQRAPVEDEDEDQDDLDALMAEQEGISATRPIRASTIQRHQIDAEDGDDLDALIAEQETVSTTKSLHTSTTQKQQTETEDEDDLDALLAEQETHRVKDSTRPGGNDPTYAQDNLDDEDYLDALVAEQEPLKPSEAKLGPDPEKQQQHHQDHVVDEDNAMIDVDDDP
nr:chromosome segregation in meiosis protein 3 [Quercus suber]